MRCSKPEPSLDHLIGRYEQGLRHREAEGRRALISSRHRTSLDQSLGVQRPP
jgi:hypothetical protein